MKLISLSHLASLAAVLVMTSSRPIAAAPDPSSQCDAAAAQASERSDVPIDILLAITRVETARGGQGPWPWTINADGQGNWYGTQDEAVTAANAHLTDGTETFDVGCFQLNMRWHGDNFANLSDMFDPVQNAHYAAGFLSQLYDESGDWAQAVSAYHSRSPDLADVYLNKVKAVLNDPSSEPPPAPEPAAHENRFPLLQAGEQGSAGSIVPLQRSRGRIVGDNS